MGMITDSEQSTYSNEDLDQFDQKISSEILSQLPRKSENTTLIHQHSTGNIEMDFSMDSEQHSVSKNDKIKDKISDNITTETKHFNDSNTESKSEEIDNKMDNNEFKSEKKTDNLAILLGNLSKERDLLPPQNIEFSKTESLEDTQTPDA
eukprot:101574_1